MAAQLFAGNAGGASEGIWYGIVDTIERVLEPLGLMTGPYAVPLRMLFGAAVGGAIVVFIKPNSMFEDGVPRPWSFLSSGRSNPNEPTPTQTPWLLGPAIGSLFFGVLI